MLIFSQDMIKHIFGLICFVSITELSVSLYDCDFEVDTCSWMQGATDDFDWSRNNGPTGSSNTGPNGDHTTGKPQITSENVIDFLKK